MKQIFLIIASVVVALLYFLFHHSLAATAWLSVGLLIGVGWYVLDPRLFYPRYQKTTELNFPLSRSFWLLIIYWPLAIFIVTSTASWLAQGLMLALGLGIAIDLGTLVQAPDKIKDAFHFPVQSKWQINELQALVSARLIGIAILVILFVV